MLYYVILYSTKCMRHIEYTYSIDMAVPDGRLARSRQVSLELGAEGLGRGLAACHRRLQPEPGIREEGIL